MLRCFNHPLCDSPVLGRGNSVLFLCDCLVSICQHCALEQVAKSAQIHNPYMRCPKCKFVLIHEQHGCIGNVPDAVSAENILVKRALTYAEPLGAGKAESYGIKMLNSCLAKLKESFPDLKNEVQCDPNSLTKFAEHSELILRFNIAGLAHKAFPEAGILHPYKMLSFARNMVLERHLSRVAGAQKVTSALVNDADVQCFCCVTSISPGHSVQLTCECDINLCRDCVLSNLAKQEDTYHKGIQCRQCQLLSRGVLKNTAYVQQCEDYLVRSAQQFLSHAVATIPNPCTENSKKILRRYHNILKLYSALGYKGKVVDAAARGRATVSVQQYRLEIARLEEMRLNKMGLLSTYTWTSAATSLNSANVKSTAVSLQIGFLHALTIKKNVFFEHLYLNQPADTIVQLKAAELTANLQVLLSKDKVLGLPEKIVALAMLMKEDPHQLEGDIWENDAQYPYRSATDVVEIVDKFLKTGWRGCEHEVVALFLKKFNEATVVRLMSKLQSAGIVYSVHDCDDDEAVYSLRDWRKLLASLDPVHRKIVDDHLAGIKCLAGASSTTVLSASGAPSAAALNRAVVDLAAEEVSVEGSKRARRTAADPNSSPDDGSGIIASTAAVVLNAAPTGIATTALQPEPITHPTVGLPAQFAALRSIVAESLNETDRLRAENARLQQQLQLAQPNADTMRALQSKVVKVRQTISELRAKNKSLTNDLDLAEDNWAHAVNARDALQRTVDKLRSENRKLKAEKGAPWTDE